MERNDCAVIIYTRTEHFYLLEAHLGLLRRYAPKIQWPVYLATEAYGDPQIQRLAKKYKVSPLPLENRYAVIQQLPAEIQYVLPVQDDFLLERPGPDELALKQALEILDQDSQVASLRLMPCPGSSAREAFRGPWKKLSEAEGLFSEQATIWRRRVYSDFLARQIQMGQIDSTETHVTTFLLQCIAPSGIHLCWPRAGSYANAVYQCPWPYRPTAVHEGVLQPFAEELLQREGFVLRKPDTAV